MRNRCLLAAMLSLTACTAATERSGSGRTMRDSAGVSIVEHSASLIASLPEWTIDTAPLAELRGDESDTQFANILDAVQRADGGTYVADQALRDIRAFTREGRFDRVIARSGRGPGEVGYVTRLQLLTGDSLAFVDANNRRLSVFAPDGHFVRQVLFPRFANGSTVRISAQQGDGRLLGSLRLPLVDAPERKDSVYRTPFAIVTFRAPAATVSDTVASPALVDTIAVVPDGEAYRANTIERGETFADEYPLRFGRTTAIASDGPLVHIATNETPEIVTYGEHGVVRRIRSERTPRPVTAQDRTRLESQVLDGVTTSARPTGQKAELQRMIQGWRYATTHPFANRLLAATDGSVWTEEPWILVDDLREYLVYDSRGWAVARVVLPPRVRALRVNLRELLGVWKDVDDVPHLRRWKLTPTRCVGMPRCEP